MENIKLKIARIEKRLSQQELADLVEVTRQTIGLIEKGKYNPSINLCVKIAKVLDKTLNDLFWEDKL
jgi:putative transcriptional regulator